MCVKDGTQVDVDILDQNLKKDETDSVVKTVYKIHAGEVCKKITVQGLYPQRIVLKRRS